MLFGKWLSGKIQEWEKSAPFGLHYQNLGLAYAHRFGLDVEGVGANAAAVTRSGEQGNIAELRIPVAASLVTKVHNVIVGPELVWSPVATSGDYASEAETLVARNSLMYYWQDLAMGAKAKDAREDSGFFSEGFVYCPWNDDIGPVKAAVDGKPLHEGDVDCRIIPSWDVIRDPSAHSYDSIPWRLHREFINKFDVAETIKPEDPADYAAQHPEDPTGEGFKDWAASEYDRKRRACLNSTMSYEFWAPLTARFENTDLIAVYFLEHEHTPSVVNGRQTRFLADGTALDDGNLDPAYERELPLQRICGGEYKGTPFPYAKSLGILGGGQAMDALRRDLLTNATAVSANIISTVEGDDFPVTNLGGPQVVKRAKDDPPPVVLKLNGSNTEAYTLMHDIQGSLQQVMGVDGLTAGTMDASKLSGAADVFLASTTVQNNSQDQAKWANFVARIGTLILHILKVHMTTPRKVALAGVGNSSLVTTTELSSQAVLGFDRVQVTVGGALQQTEAGKLTFAQMMITGNGQPGGSFVETPQQLQALVTTGRVDALNQTLSQELLLINAENEQISKGETPVVTLSDDHRLHIKEHRRPIATVAARTDPAIIKAQQDHEQEHINLLRTTDPVVLTALGQQPLPPPAMPGMPTGTPPPQPGAPRGAPPPHPGAGMATPPPEKGTPSQSAPPDAPSQPRNPVTGQPGGPVAGAMPQALAIRPS